MRAHQRQGHIHQAVAVTGFRRARYRGLQKTQLEHNSSAVALNLIRLDAWWNGHPPRPLPRQPPRSARPLPRRVIPNKPAGSSPAANRCVGWFS
ncbi:transposase [Streptomyces mirabilis]